MPTPDFKKTHLHLLNMLTSKNFCGFIFILSIYLFIGLEKIVQMLVEKGANVNALNKDKKSPLFFAASKGNISNIFSNNTTLDFDKKY